MKNARIGTLTFSRRASLKGIVAAIVTTGASSQSRGRHVLAQDAGSESTPTSVGQDLRFGILPTGDQVGDYFEVLGVSGGETIHLEALLLNIGDIGVNLRVYSTNAYSGTNGGFLAGSADEQLEGSAAWVSFPALEQFLEAGTQTIIPFTVSVPDNATAGQHISALIAETVDTFEISGSDMFDHRIRFATSVVVLVQGEITPSFELDEPIWDRGYLSVPIHNTGNYLIRLSGSIEMRNESGETIVTSEIEMGSIYAGLAAGMYLELPSQLASGNYFVDLVLTDSESGISKELINAEFLIPEPEDPRGLFLRSHSIEPNASPIVFANVNIVIDNGGAQISAADVTLVVLFEGAVVDEFPLAQSQVLIPGENEYSTRYLPAEAWETGTYTFELRINSVDPQGGREIELLNEPLDVEIVVP